jgi:phosphatase-1 catalytic subunit
MYKTEIARKATSKIVRFSDIIVCYYFTSYQDERKAYWEVYARDRHRFERRIRDLENILKPILRLEHRNKIFTQRFNKVTVKE